MTEKEKGLIKEVITNFNFKLVRDVMLSLKWNWYRNGKKSVPTIKELKEEAKFILEESIINNMSYTCGGLYSSYHDGELGLKFVLESYDTYEG